MKLPNDLIKATDYSKAKDREIHEFEYRNGKYIHKYVLGGEHKLTPQEIVDCLNAISTIDCDLQTAYTYIQSQKDKIADLETKLAEKDNALKLAREYMFNVMCADDVPSTEWFIKCAKEKLKSE